MQIDFFSKLYLVITVFNKIYGADNAESINDYHFTRKVSLSVLTLYKQMNKDKFQ
jgi:hypothetical protein